MVYNQKSSLNVHADVSSGARGLNFGPNEASSIHMGLVATKPVLGVSDKVRLKPVSSAADTS